MSKIARVYVSGVEVGSLPVAQYESIVNDANRDWRLFVLQGLNTAAIVLRIAFMCLRFTPWVWFLLSIIALIFCPEQLTQFISEFGKATPIEVTKAYTNMVEVGAFFAAFSIIILCGMGHKFGYVDQIDKAINTKLRRLLEVPTEGDMIIVYMDIDNENHHEQ